MRKKNYIFEIFFSNFLREITGSPGLSRPMSAMGGGGIYNNPTSLIDSPDGGPVSGTENPLWIDSKYKAYEEQELTMTVFSDQVSISQFGNRKKIYSQDFMQKLRENNYSST